MIDSSPLQRQAAARHVLTSPSLAARTQPHLRDGRIDWIGIAAEEATMSGGERCLVDLARRLFKGERIPAAHELSGQLDVLNLRRIAEARASLAAAPDLGLAQAA